jgi:cell division GTPase FtsZ
VSRFKPCKNVWIWHRRLVSSALAMQDYDDVAKTIHDHISEMPILVGLNSDEQMGYKLKVTVLVA